MLHSAYFWDLIVYFSIIFFISYRASRVTQNSEDFILGGRRLNSWIVALGVGASDMSGWLLMALPGAIFVNGISYMWMPIGLLIGAYTNWTVVAKRLRVRSEAANNATTIPAFIENSFHNTKIISVVTSVTILFFFTIYVSAGFVSGALLFKTIFNVPYVYSLLITFAIISVYTFIGGFIAVSWIDFFQGSLMLFALLIVPTITWYMLTHQTTLPDVSPHMFQPLHGLGFIGVISLLGWGLGYFGQPHILVRFMAINNAEKMKHAKRTAMTWMAICLFGAISCGVVGVYYYGIDGLADPESVFLSLSKDLFNPIFGGILFAAVLSAVMSTIAAQLLISASAIAEDILGRYVFKDFSLKKLLWLNRFAVLAIAVFAMFIASSPSNTILILVSYAWAGLGASFGPLIIMLVFQRRVSEFGAIMGILVGGITVVAWKHMGGIAPIFDLYEIIPGFILSWLSILFFSRFNQSSIHHEAR